MFIVVLVFLQDWRATIMPMIDVPVSLIGTFAVMALLGFSLNNLTLFGLVLAIGIVVDDAIVVVENIERWMAKGLPPREATIKAMDEITGPVIAITLVLSSVFIPTAFLAGISGQFYRQFALTIAASTIISAINAMTMAPARAVTLIKPHVHGEESQREALPRWGIALLIGYLVYRIAGPAGAGDARACPRRAAGTAPKRPKRRPIRPSRSGACGWRAVGRRQRAGLVRRAAGQRGAQQVPRRLQLGLRPALRRLRLPGPRPAPRVAHPAAGLRRSAGPDRPGLQGRAQGLHPGPGQGLPGRQRPAARRRQPGAHRPAS